MKFKMQNFKPDLKLSASKLIVPTFLLVFCISAPSWGIKQCRYWFEASRPVTMDGQKIERKQICFNGGSCFFFANKPQQRPRFHAEILKKVFAFGGRLFEHRDSNNPAVNCHSFALTLSGVPLPLHSWVDADAGFIKLINNHFVTTGVRLTTSQGFSAIRTSPQVREGDYIIMTDSERLIQHSGIVIKVNGQNWVRSKLDEGPTVDSPLEGLANYYPISYISIFRNR